MILLGVSSPYFFSIYHFIDDADDVDDVNFLALQGESSPSSFSIYKVIFCSKNFILCTIGIRLEFDISHTKYSLSSRFFLKEFILFDLSITIENKHILFSMVFFYHELSSFFLAIESIREEIYLIGIY